MSSEPVVPPNVENAQESPDFAPEADRELRDAVGVRAGRAERLLEREYTDSRPLGEIPGEARPKLRETAETVGTVVGRAVNRARELPQRLAGMKDRFTVIRGRVREDAASTAEEVGETAKQRFQQAQTRVEYYAHEYPIQFILGVGAACFGLGVIMRIWRSNSRG